MTSLPLVRVRLKHVDPETFVQRFAPNVTRGGIFLASRDPRPVGALIRFEVTLVSGAVMMAGQGRVAWVKPYDLAQPSRAHGMGVQFTELDPASRPMFDRLLERKETTAGRGAPARASGVVAAPAPGSGSERRVTEGNLTEFDAVEDTALRRALDRARALAPAPDKLDDILAPAEPLAPVSLDEALADLPRYFARGRGSGLFRVPAELRSEPPAPSTPTAAATTAVPEAVEDEATRPMAPGEMPGPEAQDAETPGPAALVNGVPSPER